MSPVIGMIMILAISVVGVSAVLVWGLPAIESMKEQVEYKSVQNQFDELDATVRELVAGTAGKTAKRWQPSLSRGGITIEANTERWLVATDRDASYNFTYIEFVDADNALKIVNHGASSVTIMVNASLVDGASETLLNVSAVSGSSIPMTTAGAVTIASGASQEFWTYTTVGVARSHYEGTFHFEITDSTTSQTVGEAWIVDTGAIHYKLIGAAQPRHVYSSNGAIIPGQGDGFFVDNTPPIPAPRTSAGSHRFFMRTVQFNGTGSFSGEARFDVLFSLYSTATLSDETGVPRIKIYATGNLTNAWHTFFLDEARGYNFTTVTETVGSEGRTYLEYEYSGGMVFTLVHSVITAST